MNDIRENLKAYLDGELSAAEFEVVQRAVEADPQLQKECDQMKFISNSLRAYSPVATPSDAEASKASIKVQTTKKRSIWRSRGFALAVAGAGCLMLAAIIFPTFAQVKEARKDTAAMATRNAMDKAPHIEFSQATESASDEAPTASSKDLLRDQSKVASSVPPATPSIGGINRDIVKTGAISITVVDVIQAQADAKRLAVAAQGYVENSTLDKQGEYRTVASLTIRVPAAKFDDTLEKVRKFGDVTSESESGVDVTSQIIDYDARIATQKDQIASLREILRQARKLGEIIELRDRIAQIQAEVDSITQQRNVLKTQAALSTINLTLNEKLKAETSSGAQKGWLEDTWANAIQNLGSFGRVVGGIAVHILVYSPIWLPIVIVVWLIARRSKAS